ncbi:hypothetical protein LTR36_001801 [Oleoguttula mirabilis]|uniref:ubiquitinyl hydrolase 1 n=1 Tax=Oleoguttula mirabilis TaxID=1507867 RepID=A0AAV9JMJ1_9PEZI|nr:hypothetical protein LTR36_001801 [Oleoguttula mirabilis]
MHEEVLQSKELAAGTAPSEGGASPSGQFAGIHIDSGSSMSGSENGGNGNNNDSRALSSPNGGIGARSASPAKRSAADMEDAGSAGNNAGQQTQQTVPGSFTETQGNGHTDYDEAMAGMTNGSNSVDTQETVADSDATSAEGAMTANTSATSLQAEELPPYSEEEKWKKGSSKSSRSTLPSIDEQVKQVSQIAGSASLDEGTKGYLVSSKWLSRVRARSTDGLDHAAYAKEAREGPIGMVDNSDLVLPGAFDSGLLDFANVKFVTLKPGLTMGIEFEVLPAEAWILIMDWYGRPKGHDHAIVRYAHNTADPPAQNIIYEIYPPVLTIRKVSQQSQQTDRPPTPQGGSFDALQKRKELRARGQTSSDDAVKLVSSRSERMQKFLRRAKESSGIPLASKVKLWRELVPEKVSVDTPDDTETSMLSPPQSRSTSPAKVARTTAEKLIVSPAEFKAMEIGQNLEHIDAKDETNNDKYNGASTVLTYGMFEDQTILLEEQIGGPAGGEFQSDGKKGPKLSLGKKFGSKPASATPSGRTSPTPGGMLTRGRARRDGRTRGTVGLSNLGNTCYMNSALQCIRSVQELALYFLSGKYKSEINTSNPLGHKGLMAKQYAGVLEGIYADTASGAFSPSAFKKTLGNVQPLFSGYQQQDSQEFLSFLVDALHEDLNRIIKKPYNENPDSDDKTVHDPQAIIELGETYRANHKARNDSVAMDLFSGFYKNTMECPVCDKISITFDPFSSLTVQLPVESTFQHTITFVPLVGAPINHAVDIDKNASIKTLKDNIASKHPGVTGDRLWMVEVYNHKIYKLFEDQQSIAEANFQANDYIFVYELPGVPTNVPELSRKKSYVSSYSFNSSSDKEIVDMASPKAENFAVPVFSRQKNRFGNGFEIIMHPLYITLTRDEAQNFEIILKKVLVAVSRMTSRSILTEFDTDKSSSAGGSATDAGTSAETENEESAGEDAAHLSDRSVPSEDGYVNVSIDKAEQPGATEEMKDAEADAERIARFMDPHHPIGSELRNQLFALNFTKSAEGSYCTGMQSISERDVRNMFERVKKPARRASVQSSTSGDSSTSTGSGQGNGESDESDADDDEDKPDITLGFGEEDTLHLQTPTSAEPTSDDGLPDNPLQGHASNNRRRGTGKQDKFGKNRNRKKGLVTYGKKDGKARRGQQQRPGSSGSLRSTQSQRSLTGKPPLQDENPYYIKLGEGIVLDWYLEGLDSLFRGDAKVPDEMRGHWLSSADGRNLDFMPDPVLDAKKEKRAARKKNGITLGDCFAETGKREILSEDNAWYCGRCKEMRQAAKTLEIWTIPDILIVHLKRFGGNRSFRDKIDVFVDYPIEGLDMTEKIGLKEDGKEYLYDLFAVDNHYGGLGGGHYTALAKNFYDEQWYDYNDSSCSKVGEGKVHSPAAYLLFYRRRSKGPLGSQILQDIVNEAKHLTQSESAGEDPEESDSGEGRLGGPTSLLRGSSSALVAAGAGTNASLRSIASGGAPGAGNSLTTKEMTMTGQNDGDDGSLGTLNGKRVIGPHRPPHLQYGSQGAPSWNFDELDQPTQTDGSPTERLLGGMVDPDADADVDSTAAEADSAVGMDDDYQRSDVADEEYNNRDSSGYGRANSRANSPSDTAMAGYLDDHSLYSDAHDHQNPEMDTMHVEDSGTTGADPDSPPAYELHLSDDMEGVTGLKRD